MKDRCIMIAFEKNWNFKFADFTQSLTSDYEYEFKLYYPQNAEQSSIRIYESLSSLIYLLFIDELEINKDQMESFLQKFKKPSKLEELRSQNALFIALLIILSKSQYYNDSLFFSFIKYFSQKEHIQFGGYINKVIHEYIIPSTYNLGKQSSTYNLNYYTLFYCFFMNGSDFINENFAEKLIQQENTNFFTNLIQLFDEKFFYSKYPDRFREALILTAIFYIKKGGKFSMEQLDKKEDTLEIIRSKVVKHDDDNKYLNEFFNRLYSLLAIQRDVDIWSCFINILKRVLPKRYWDYFIDNIFLQLHYFQLCYELTSRIIIEHNLINQFILKQPNFFDKIFNLILSDRDYCEKIDKKVFQNYYKTFGSSSFHKLLLTNQEKDNFENYEITNRLKYFDILTCLLKLCEMTFEQFIDSKNEEEIKDLKDFYEKLENQKFVDYSGTSEKLIKDAFKAIISHKFSKITKDFNEDCAYIIKITDDPQKLGVDAEYKFYENGIFNQMIQLNKTIKDLMKLFIDDDEYDIFAKRVKTIKKFFKNDPDSLPIEISYSEMIGYKSKTEESIIDISKYLTKAIKLAEFNYDEEPTVNPIKHNIKKPEPNDDSDSNDESSSENIAALKLKKSKKQNKLNKGKTKGKLTNKRIQYKKTDDKGDNSEPVDKEKNKSPPPTEETDKNITIEEEEEKEKIEPEKEKTENPEDKNIKIEEEEEEKEKTEPEERKAENINQENKDIKIEEEEEEKTENPEDKIKIKIENKDKTDSTSKNKHKPKQRLKQKRSVKKSGGKLTKKKSQTQPEPKSDDKSDKNSDETNDDTKDTQKENNSSDQENNDDDDKNSDSTNEGENKPKKTSSTRGRRGKGNRVRGRRGRNRARKSSTKATEQNGEDSGDDDSQDEGDENE